MITALPRALQKLNPAALISGLVAIFCLNVVALSLQRPFNSDDVAQQVILRLWSQGYHSGTIIGPDNYVLRFPLHLLIGNLPLSPRLALVITTVLLAALTALSFALALKLLLPKRQLISALWVSILMFASLAPSFYDVIMNPNVRSMEIGISFVIVALAIRGHQLIDRQMLRRPGVLVILGAATTLVGLFVYNDPYFLYTLIVPIMIVGALGFVLGRMKGDVYAIGAASVVASLIWFKIWGLALGGLLKIGSFGSVPAFISTDQLSAKFSGFIGSLLLIFNADFLGRPIGSLAGLRAVIHLVFLFALVVYVYRVATRFRTTTLIDQTISAMAITICLIFLISDLPVASRYLVILPFCAVLGMTGILTTTANFRLRAALWALLAFSAVIGLAGSLKIIAAGDHHPNAANKMIVDEAKDLALNKGYATYWNANINAYFSKGEISFVPVNCAPHSISFRHWLIDKDVLRAPSKKSFYLFQDGECTSADLVPQLGPPVAVRDLGDHHMAVYSYDIGKRLQ